MDTHHMDRCRTCRRVWHHVALAMRAFRGTRHLEAVLQLYAALDTLATTRGCQRGMTLLLTAATELRQQDVCARRC